MSKMNWKLKDLAYIRTNLHLSDRELGKMFGCSADSISWARRTNNISKKGIAVIRKRKAQTL